MQPENEFHEYLRETRISLGLSISSLSEITGISTSHISRIESGKRKPSLEALEKLAESLELDFKETVKQADMLEKASSSIYELPEILLQKHLYIENKLIDETLRKELISMIS